MPIFDIILIIIVAGFGLFGLWFGFVHTLGSLIGTVLGAFVASRFYEPLADWLISTTGWGENLSRVVMFIFAFIIITRLFGVVFWILESVLQIFIGLPIISSIDKLLGMILGLFEGIVSVGLIIYFIERFPLSDVFMGYIANSKIAPFVVDVSSVLLPLLPEALKVLRSTVDYVENIVL